MDLLLESARRRKLGHGARLATGGHPSSPLGARHPLVACSDLRRGALPTALVQERPPLGFQAHRLGSLLACVALCFLASCGARRSVLIETTPPGALIRLDDEVVGTTPLEYPFVHYGTRRVTLYLPGYRTWSEQIAFEPRWYARFPMDLITEVLLPLNLRDQRKVNVELVADDGSESTGDADAFVERAQALRAADLALDVEQAPEAGPEASADPTQGPAVQPRGGAGSERRGVGPR